RGEVLSIAAGAGNRQQNISISYQAPYFPNRPIAVGAPLFLSRYRLFGDGTFLAQNADPIADLLYNPYATVATHSSNLFTQSTYGVNVFASAPLSELFFKKRRFTTFSRIGLTYQLSSTSIQDPEINQSDDPASRIPVIYEQPGILTSRLIG